MARRSYAGAAVGLNGTATMAIGDTSFAVTAVTGNWPDGSAGPFAIAVNRGFTDEEKILVTTRAGTTFSGLTRGYDGTSAVSHGANFTVELIITSVDADEANAHVNATSGVHGITGTVVGTTDTQTLSAKTLTAPTIGDFTNAAHDHSAANKGGAVGFPVAATSTSAVSDVASDGTNTKPARADHKHGRENFGTPPSTSAVGDAANWGLATTIARSDHLHGREAFGTPGSSAVGDAAAQGAATTVARSDHVHGREALIATAETITAANESTSSTTYVDLTTVGPAASVVVPASGRVLVLWEALASTTTAGNTPDMSWVASGAATIAVGTYYTIAYIGAATNDFTKIVAFKLLSGLTPGQTLTVTAKYRARAGGGTSFFQDRTIVLLPAP